MAARSARQLKGASYNLGNVGDKARQLRHRSATHFGDIPIAPMFETYATEAEFEEAIIPLKDEYTRQMKAIFQEFSNLNYDFICLQEVGDKETLTDYLKDTNFDFYLPDRNECAIVINRNTLQYLHSVNLDRVEPGQLEIKIIQETNATLARFRVLSTGWVIEICSLHLTGYWIPDFDSYQEAGYRQMLGYLGHFYNWSGWDTFLSYLTSSFERPVATIVAGDFNSPSTHGFPGLLGDYGFKKHPNTAKTAYSGDIDQAYVRHGNFVNPTSNSLTVQFQTLDGEVSAGPSDHHPIFFELVIGK